MSALIESRSENYLRFSRRSMGALLAEVLVIGTLCMVMTLWPGSGQYWMVQAGWLLPVAITIGLVTLQRTTLRGGRWRPDVAEVRTIMDDEWRRVNLNRAMRFAFTGVLILQVPLGLTLAHLPALRAVIAMATATTTVGMTTLISLFLYFDRETRDAG